MIYLMVTETRFYYKNKDNVLEIGEDYLTVKTVRVSIEKIDFNDIEFINTAYQRVCIYLKNPLDYLEKQNLSKRKIDRILKNSKKYGHVFIMFRDVDAKEQDVMSLLFDCWQKGKKEEN